MEMGFGGHVLEENLLASCLGCLVSSFRHLDSTDRSHLENFASLKDADRSSAALCNIDQFIETVLRFAQTYCSFSAGSQTSTTSVENSLLYHGIANTPVESGDRIIIPATWNISTAGSSSRSCFRALVLRPVDGCSSFSIAGLAWVVPDRDLGVGNPVSLSEVAKLQEGFEEREISLELV
jgi:hypothetical protein